jgi:phosphate-selective porin
VLFLVAALTAVLAPHGLHAQEADTTAAALPKVGYGSRGIFIETADGNWRTSLQFRMQFRMSNPFDADPDRELDYTGQDQTSLEVNRARFKVDGHGYRPWLKYYTEFDLPNSRLLNWELKVEKYSAIRLRVGQWKAYYSRERVVSSGRQQMADRSLVNRYFTIDRQQGVSLYGRLFEGSLADVNYWVSAFTGMGTGGRENDDTALMYMGRLQWNPLGRPVAFAGGDLSKVDDPALSIAVAGTTNESPCTRFSGSGCGTLPGFDGDYRVNQATLETAFIWKGFSWTQELHWKMIRDVDTLEETDLRGNYAMIGFFPSVAFESVPQPLEVAVRWSVFDPNLGGTDDLQAEELTFAANWFFGGHSNKLTAEYALFDLQSGPDELSRGRYRLQWEIQF